ncbi:MAG: glycosyltransferase family 4 protein [candidate division WOR-3 bacterium]|nr:glycosyltransferase family 4 protein [candidate division WOR-3 bacterium]
MKVVYINKYFFPMERHSGILNFAYDLCNSLAQKLDLEVISWKYSKEIPNRKGLNNYTVHRVRSPFRLYSAILAKHLRPDIVILGSGIIYPGILLFVVLLLKIISPGIPLVIYQHSIFKQPSISLSWFFNRLCAGFWFSNPYQKDQIKKRIYIDCVYVSVGLDPKRLNSITFVQKQYDIRIGYFGHLSESKGVDRLIRAFLKLDNRNCELLIAGTGPLKGKLEEIATKRENINIYGYLKDVLGYMKSCDIIVFPYREDIAILGLSLSCLETMALGKPIIVSNSITLIPFIKPGYNGFIFEKESELVRYLKLLINDQEKRRRMGERAKNLAKKYSIAETANKVNEFIKETLNVEGD